MQPGSGIRSPLLFQSEIEAAVPSSSKECVLKTNRLLSTKQIESKEAESLQRKACCNVLNFVIS